MIVVTLPGTVRIKKNSKRVIKRGPVTKVLPSCAYVKWEKAARAAFLEQFGGIRSKYTWPLHVKVVAYFKGPQPDLSGVLESIGDCLEGYLWEDDRQIKSWDGSRLVHDLDNPRTVVVVERFDSGEERVNPA